MPRKQRVRANGEGSVYERVRNGTTVFVAEVVWTDPRTMVAQRLTAQRSSASEARRALNILRLRAQDAARPPRPRDSRIVAEAMSAYLEDAALRIGATAVATYRTIIEGHVIPTLGNRRANSVTRADVVRWMTDLRAGGVGDRTIQVAYQRLKAVLAPDVAHLRPEEYPFPPRGGPRVADPDVAFWGADEVRRFVTGIEDDPHQGLLLLVLSTGLRQGEALGLVWGDLDTTRAIVRVARSRSRDGGRATKAPKTSAGRRDVYLPPQALAALDRHRERQRVRCHGVERADPMFTGPSGGALSAPAAYHALQRVIERLGLPRISFHALRHTAATLMLESGVNVKTVQAVLGHADPTLLLRRYGHVIPGAQAAAAAAMAAIMSPPEKPRKVGA